MQREKGVNYLQKMEQKQKYIKCGWNSSRYAEEDRRPLKK